jgi:hypothetical protein
VDLGTIVMITVIVIGLAWTQRRKSKFPPFSF